MADILDFHYACGHFTFTHASADDENTFTLYLWNIENSKAVFIFFYLEMYMFTDFSEAIFLFLCHFGDY